MKKYSIKPFKIVKTKDGIMIDDDFAVPDDALNEFLYSILLEDNREELKERLIEGRKLRKTGIKMIEDKDFRIWTLGYLENQEDFLLKELLK